MLIRGGYNTDRDKIFTEKTALFVNSLKDGEKLLVLTLNPYKKAKFIKELKSKIGNFDEEKIKIYTLFGLCYNAFKDNEGYIKKLSRLKESEEINLCGLEVSRFIFRQCIKEADFSDYISKVNLQHQLFRRYSLIVNNMFTKKEIRERSKILKESFYEEAQEAIENYKRKTVEYKSFDYLRQSAVLPFIFKNTKYFSNFKYLVCDDTDEYSYIFVSFIKSLIPKLKDYVLAYDEKGSSRCGYLCAYINGINDIKKNFRSKEIICKEKYETEADKFYNAIINSKKIITEKISNASFLTRRSMNENLIKEIKKIVLSGIKPCEIALVTPCFDEDLIQTLEDNEENLKFKIISGSENFSDFKITSIIISILKIINDAELKPLELSSLLIKLLGIPRKKTIDIEKYYAETKELRDFSFKNKKINEKYKKLQNTIKSLKQSNNKISVQTEIIYENLIKGNFDETETTRYNFFVKEAKGFEAAFSSKFKETAKEFLSQIENGIISENPSETMSLEENSVIVATPQKLIDFGIRTKYLFISDTSSSEWFKDDTGTIYNACVFNRDREIKEYKYEDCINFTKEKTARTLRKLLNTVTGNTFFYSSIYDAQGRENGGGIEEYTEGRQSGNAVFKIIPRDDQKKVLEYEKGQTAITAVPGAGKTTVLTALTVKLFEKGINPEKIYILTYMDSAAKTFKERLKSALPEGCSLPNVSTIHGLAYRIIKENGNYALCGLDDNFDICDDNLKDKIIKELFFKLKIDEDKQADFIKCLSTVKPLIENGIPDSKYKEIREFFDFLREYNNRLKSENLIDYDDMLILATELLEKNKEIATYYAEECEYIIEDEAQDSTYSQQKLINILKSKHNNYIRCGDINQSITSTFTNSTPDLFKNFILNNEKVEMTSSQRCAKEIYTFANSFLKKASAKKDSKNAFYDIEMKGTDKNPKGKQPEYNYFENEKEEKSFIVNKIKEIKKNDEKASVAVLLRYNFSVGTFGEYLSENDIKTVINGDCLAQKNLFKIILTVLKISLNPNCNENFAELANLYGRLNKRKFTKEETDYIRNCKKSFIFSDIDDLPTENLEQLFWDCDYLLNEACTDIAVFALKTGLFYAETSDEKSNAYIISTFFKRISAGKNNPEEILNAAEYYSQKSAGTFCLYETEEGKNDVKVMTLHKSKGDEFDYVFIPGLSSENFPCKLSDAKIKTGGHFVQTVKNAADKKGIMTHEEQKTELINESARLLYVGITRAKKGLYMSYSKNGIGHKNSKPSELISDALNNCPNKKSR